MKAISNANKFTIADTATYSPDLHQPNPRGWYHSVVNVVDTPEGLVCVYRLSDSHTAVYTHIMVAFSADGGKTWSGHRSISHRNVWEHHAVWVAPQLSRLSDGRLVVICDMGHRCSGDSWPMITDWQRSPRGMGNYLFWSDDNGRTWSEPQKIDEVGGEPSYITELSAGTLVFTRTEPAVKTDMYDPPAKWGNQYYLSVAVFSDDRGNTWNRASVVTDDPYEADNEVAILELEPDHLIAFTRIGFGGGAFGQPSRMAHSHDNGRSWSRAELTPYYAQRAIIRRLMSGRLLVTYRNRWGTPGSRAAVFDASERHGFEPSSRIIDEARCRLSSAEMTLSTGREPQQTVEFSLYPAIDDQATVDLDVELKLAPESEAGSAYVCAGFRVRFSPEALELLDRAGTLVETVPVDTTEYRRYRLRRDRRRLSVAIDGNEVISRPIDGLDIRLVRFGADRSGGSSWRRMAAHVHNPDDYSIEWIWDPSKGFPDQFQRDRTVMLDIGGEGSDSGYSGWTQMQDATIVIADYTNAHHLNSTWNGGPLPFARAYVVREEDLV